MINWAKIKQIKDIHNFLQNNKKIIDLREDRDHFQDKASNHIFFFNKMFLEYLMDYMKCIEIIFHLKKCDNITKLSSYVKHNQIGFEVFHFFLKRISSALRLLNILWKLLNDQKAVETYEYIIEVISNQIFVEYSLIKNNIKIFVESLELNSKPSWLVGFLYLYSDFIWKNKKLIELYDNFGWFYKRKFIKMPIILNFEDEVLNSLNEQLIEFEDKVNIQRKSIEYMEEERLLKTTEQAFDLLLSNEMPDIDEKLLFSQHSMLNKFSDNNEARIPVTSLVINSKKNFIKSKNEHFENVEEFEINNQTFEEENE